MDSAAQSLRPLIKTILGTLYKIVLTIIGYTALGFVLNVALLVSRWDRFAALSSGSASMGTRAVSGLLLVCVCALPIVFFFVGKRQAIQGAISGILRSKKYDLILFLLKVLSERQPEILAQDPMISPSLSVITSSIAKAHQGIPWILSVPLSQLAARVDFAARLISAIDANKAALNGSSIEQKQATLASIISEMIPDDLMAPDLAIPLIVLAINIGLFWV